MVRRDVHRSGQVWSEQALRVITDTGDALVTACPPGSQALWPALYAKARVDGDRSVRTEAFDAMATGQWELAPGVWPVRLDVRRGTLKNKPSSSFHAVLG
ncbi:hypothetical protein ACFYYR_25095 [Streptomyces sp. NPDC001922]|uniref:hypothetical protein n=1 Tax=Streptomyces sp. NPDC001922 TaxID=3364624 RepID=UPI0036C7C58B